MDLRQRLYEVSLWRGLALEARKLSMSPGHTAKDPGAPEPK